MRDQASIILNISSYLINWPVCNQYSSPLLLLHHPAPHRHYFTWRGFWHFKLGCFPSHHNIDVLTRWKLSLHFLGLHPCQALFLCPLYPIPGHLSTGTPSIPCLCWHSLPGCHCTWSPSSPCSGSDFPAQNHLIDSVTPCCPHPLWLWHASVGCPCMWPYSSPCVGFDTHARLPFYVATLLGLWLTPLMLFLFSHRAPDHSHIWRPFLPTWALKLCLGPPFCVDSLLILFWFWHLLWAPAAPVSRSPNREKDACFSLLYQQF